MNSFIIHTPTRIHFDPEHAAAFGAEVTDTLKTAGLTATFFSGIEPNPEATTAIP